MNGKFGNGVASGLLACIEGLPPLPKSLSGLLNSSGGSWREMERMYVKKTMIQDDLSRGRNNTDSLLVNKPANLDAALALLRKEMVRVKTASNSCSPGCRRSFKLVGLRQQDMSLLCQLWSLHESIQEYKGSWQDLSAVSSADGPYGIENGYFDEDEEYYTESVMTPAETPAGNYTSPKNGTSKDSWIHDSFHITI
ncbi:protein FAM89A-like isoform X1 [Xyrauchen texanus]|uniref:protein FAM89A-like isoform X1 n=1 Tax=Xyrauchen texanus TaxID=154827 RepID=UPI0022424381|nr:protein FAM89A-like isoform X1 [Xyrauchen texanus]